MDELSEEDKLVVARARKLEKYMSQPFFVAEVFTGMDGVYRRRVSLINYKGGSGRFWGAKFNESNGKSLSKYYFFNETCKCQKNQKMDVEKNTTKLIKIQKKCF